MWGSILVGDDYDVPFDMTGLDLDVMEICGQLSQHPLLKSPPPQQGQSIMGAPQNENPATPSGGSGQLTPQQTPKDLPGQESDEQKRIKELAGQLTQKSEQKLASESSIGWFDSMGRSAESIVKDLKMARRDNKVIKEEIDDLIDAVRLMKRMEIDSTLKKLSWASGHHDTIKALGLSDRDLQSLQKYGETRKSSLLRACLEYEAATERIDTLTSNMDDWTSMEKQAWVESHNDRDAAKKSWTTCLHTLDTLNKSEMSWLQLASQELELNGSMDTRTIVGNMIEKGQPAKKLSVNKLGALMKTYGDEVGIIKGVKRGEWMIRKRDGSLVIKDPWAYAAGFIDADGYITITKRGEPRVGLVATGERGRIHCEQLAKTLDCGVLQLDLKVYKDAQRSQHRLQFYSKNDIAKILKGILPHLQLKKGQAQSVLEYIATPHKGDIAKQRRQQLEKLVKWDNWSDKKADELLNEWGITEGDIESWRDPTLMRLAVDVERLTEAI